MADQWWDKSWTPITGCPPDINNVECHERCWARALAGRFPAVHGDANFDTITYHLERMGYPLKWRKPQRIFVCPIGDLFHNGVPNSYQLDVLRLASRVECQKHTFFFLTKRPMNMRMTVRRFLEDNPGSVLDHCWFGTSIPGGRENYGVRVLLDTPVKNRFISYEPALGPCWPILRTDSEGRDLTSLSGLWSESDNRISLCIAGAETGPGRRMADPEWFRNLRERCLANGVKFYLKNVDGRGSPQLDGSVFQELP